MKHAFVIQNGHAAEKGRDERMTTRKATNRSTTSCMAARWIGSALLAVVLAACSTSRSTVVDASREVLEAAVVAPDGGIAPDTGTTPEGGSTPAHGACIDTVVSGTNDLSQVQGGLIAFNLRDAQGLLQIFVAKPDGTERRQLTFEGENGLADWSPDGQQLTYMAIPGDASGQQGAHIGVMNADGSNQRLIASDGVSPDWSPDGSLIAFARGGQIWTIQPDGTGEQQLSSGSLFKARPSWSHDAQQLVFIVIVDPTSPTSPRPEIGIMNADGTNERILTVEDRSNVCSEADGSTRDLETAHDANAPSWSPVDDRIVFWSGIETKYGQVWSIRADGTASTQLTHETRHSNNDDPSWSPDGTKVLFSTGRSDQNELWVMDADGGNEMRLWRIDAGPFPGRGAWQPVP